MRIAAHPSGAQRATAAWPAGLAAACIAVVAAGIYLCLSIFEALEPTDRAELPWETGSGTAANAHPDADAAAPGGEVRAGDSGAPAIAPVGGVPSVPSPLLADRIRDAAGADADHIAVSVRRVTDGLSASYEGNVQYYAASTFKLAVLYEATIRLSDGRLNLDDKLTMSDEDAAEDLGTSAFLHFEEDGSITIRNLLTPMIEVSDNSSAVTLMHAFGSANIDTTLRSIGIETMTVNREELWTTADDLSRLMLAIYTGEGMTPEVRDFARGLLLNQTIRSGIPQALAGEIAGGLQVGNKTGTWEGAQHDVAFVEDPAGAYVIAILTDGSYEGWQAMHRVAQSVQQTLAN